MPDPLKSYDYPTGNIEMMMRMQAGEPFPIVMEDIRTKWTPGNEHLWDEYDVESLVDSDEKRQYTVNQLIHARISVYRALKTKDIDCRGSDPFDSIAQVPDLSRQLRARFPESLDWLGGGDRG
jgi:hypothetical protein